MGEARRHHYVPQFYLRRFGDQKNQVRMIRRSTGKEMTVSVTNAAVEVGFYDIEPDADLPRDLFESMLSDIESEVAATLTRIDKQPWPPSDDDRAALALFMALQVVRTPEHRFFFEELAEVQAKALLAGTTRDQARDSLIEEGVEPTDEAVEERWRALRENLGDYRVDVGGGYMWGLLLTDVAPRLAVMMAEGYEWHLVSGDRKLLATSDHPVLLWVRNPSRFMGVGVGTADAIVLPLDSRKHLLLFREGVGRSTEIPLSRLMAKETNHYLLGHSYEWVFHDPRISPFTADDLTPRRRGAFMLNDQEITQRGDSWKVFSDIFTKMDDAYFGKGAENE